MLAAVAGCLMSVCIAFAGTVDIATNFFGLVVTVIAKGLLNAADIVLEPLLEITTMSTADVSRFVPGFDSGNNIGNFFIQAINIIAYMIAGVLICCHIISYQHCARRKGRVDSEIDLECGVWHRNGDMRKNFPDHDF